MGSSGSIEGWEESLSSASEAEGLAMNFSGCAARLYAARNRETRQLGPNDSGRREKTDLCSSRSFILPDS